MMFVALAVGVWLAVAAFVLALCRAAGKTDERVEAAFAFERREVGYCGSCGGPVLLDPVAGKATCPCGACEIPQRFMHPGGRG